MPLRIAHRGMPRLARENTLPSFAMAMEAGADGLELDVHATRDGVVVIHHDATLASGADIAQLTFAELRRHDAAPGVAIPTLAELCDLVDDRAELFVELKGAGIEREVLAVLADHRGSHAVHGFDHAQIARVRALDPSIRLGILLEAPPPDLVPVMRAAGATDVWPYWPLVTAPLVAAVHAAGGRVIPWTVNDSARAAALAALGVDALCGDDVTILPPR